MSRRRDRPYVSCIVTTFNYAHYVTEAIDSVLAQTYGEDALEVIVVDGASTDETPSVVEPYGSAITYIREPSNEGVVSSANRGLEMASGDLIAFLNADDAWYPSTVERLAGRLAAKPDSGLVYGDMEMIDADGRSVHPSYYEQFGVRPASGRLLGPLLRRNFIASGCFMFRAELLPACHPIPDWVPWEDWYMTLRLAQLTRFEYLPEPVLRYRFHGANQVLMAEGERLVATWHKELAFRRRVLIEISPEAVTAADLVGAVEAFDDAARRLGEAAPDRLAAALPTGEPERAEAAAAAAAAARNEADREDEAALFRWTRALAHDPGDRDIRRRFAVVAARLLDEEAAAAEELRTALKALERPGPAWTARTPAREPVAEALDGLRTLAARVATLAPEPAARPRPLLAELTDELAGRRVLDVPAGGWEELDPHELGSFDLIHADGLLDREPRALAALERVRELLADGGRLYLGFTRVADVERSAYVRLVDGGPDGGIHTLPGRTALRWMVESAGLSPLRELAVEPSERGGIPVECGYLELAT